MVFMKLASGLNKNCAPIKNLSNNVNFDSLKNTIRAQILAGPLLSNSSQYLFEMNNTSLRLSNTNCK